MKHYDYDYDWLVNDMDNNDTLIGPHVNPFMIECIGKLTNDVLSLINP